MEFTTQILLIGAAILILQLIILVKVNRAKGASDGAEADVAAPASPALVPAAAPVVQQQDDAEIAAVIAAAVAAMDTGGQFVVRSIRRVGVNAPAWSSAGRTDIINTRN